MLPLVRRCFAFLAATLSLAGCGSEDEFTANVAGDYAIGLTNRESSCSFMWTEGEMTPNVGFTITQEGSKVHGTVTGPAAIVFGVVLGSAEFDGTVNKQDVTLTNYGTRTATEGTCTFSYNATVKGTITGDAIAGTITYAPDTNSSPECADVKCAAVQEFSGSRPPN